MVLENERLDGQSYLRLFTQQFSCSLTIYLIVVHQVVLFKYGM